MRKPKMRKPWRIFLTVLLALIAIPLGAGFIWFLWGLSYLDRDWAAEMDFYGPLFVWVSWIIRDLMMWVSIAGFVVWLILTACWHIQDILSEET
ncbi:MAG: hypothetical protein WBD63_01125 [Phycisphaerae bacterium]